MRTTRPAKPMVTFFDTLFPKSIAVARQAPLLRNNLALFEEHWPATERAKFQVHAHNSVDLLRRTAAKWRTDLLCAEASAAHTEELQTQVAALEANLVNPVEENPVAHVLKASGSAKVAA